MDITNWIFQKKEFHSWFTFSNKLWSLTCQLVYPFGMLFLKFTIIIGLMPCSFTHLITRITLQNYRILCSFITSSAFLLKFCSIFFSIKAFITAFYCILRQYTSFGGYLFDSYLLRALATRSFSVVSVIHLLKQLIPTVLS